MPEPAADHARFVDEALGAVLLRGGPHGAIAVAFSPEDAADASLAWPDAVVLSPREIGELEKIRESAGLAAVINSRRIFGGAIARIEPRKAQEVGW